MNQQKIAVNVSRIEQISPNIKMFEFVAQEGALMPLRRQSHYRSYGRAGWFTTCIFVNQRPAAVWQLLYFCLA